MAPLSNDNPTKGQAYWEPKQSLQRRVTAPDTSQASPAFILRCASAQTQTGLRCRFASQLPRLALANIFCQCLRLAMQVRCSSFGSTALCAPQTIPEFLHCSFDVHSTKDVSGCAQDLACLLHLQMHGAHGSLHKQMNKTLNCCACCMQQCTPRSHGTCCSCQSSNCDYCNLQATQAKIWFAAVTRAFRIALIIKTLSHLQTAVQQTECINALNPKQSCMMERLGFPKLSIA